MITKKDIKILTDKVLDEKQKQGLTWDDLSKNLPIAGNSLRMSFKRDLVKINFLEIICNDLEIDTKKELAMFKESDKSDYINSPLIGKFEYDYYKKHYDDKEYINSLPKFIWRTGKQQQNSNLEEFRTFEIVNNQMNDSSYRSILIGDFLLCKLISRTELKNVLKNDSIFGYLHWDHGVQFKLIQQIDFAQKQIKVISLSTPENSQIIEFSECAEFYELTQLDRKTKF